MNRAKIKRHIMSVFMESPFYFTLSIPRRLEFINFSLRQSVYHRISAEPQNLLSEQLDSGMFLNSQIIKDSIDSSDASFINASIV